MVLDIIRNLIADKEPTPNKFTIAMGELIRKAREEASLTQSELAKNMNRRQATLSDIENGKVEVSSGTLALLSAMLEKPITYFFPPFLYRELKPEELTPLEQQLLSLFRQIWDEHLQKVAVNQVKILAEFNPEEMIWDLVDISAEMKERDDKIKEYIEQRKKNRN